MKDFAHRRNEVKVWKGHEERRVAFLGRLTEIIRGNTRRSISSAVRLQDYERRNRAYRLKESGSGINDLVIVLSTTTNSTCRKKGK